MNFKIDFRQDVPIVDCQQTRATNFAKIAVNHLRKVVRRHRNYRSHPNRRYPLCRQQKGWANRAILLRLATENREKVGFFEAIWQTWQESVFNPEKFYSHLPSRGGYGNPLLYAVIILWIATIINQAYNIIFSGFFHGLMARFIPTNESLISIGMQTGMSLLYMIIAPIFIVAGLFIMSGIYHLIFLIFGWSKRDFEATFRAVAYSAGPAIFFIVPFCGSLVGWIWSAVLTVIGLKYMQETTGGKATFVYVLPAIVCCCLIAMIAIVIFIIFGAAFFSNFGHAFGGSFN